MISILMPAYIENIEGIEWLNEAIESVQQQNFADWELLVMDDASPLPPSLQDVDARIRYFRMTSRVGPALCRNTAAALASYDCLLPLDADDMLASTEVLRTKYEVWQQDKTKIIYGDLQRYEVREGEWQRSKVLGLPEYTFDRSLDLNGILPVTSMHSFECHQRAGGWKPNIEAGLEDVEYWISAGKAGFCGQRINITTLLYRKHENSRTSKLLASKRKTEMQKLIRSMHQDVYEGKRPMGCCGGGGRAAFIPSQINQQQVSPPSTLDGYPPNELIWVEYRGKREGSFGMVGPFTNYSYDVDGPGHKLQVHLNDLSKFRRSGRGMDFAIGVQAPNGVSVPERSPDNARYEPPAPQVAQIERLDDKAMVMNG